MSVLISGTGICSGVAIGSAHIVTKLDPDIPKINIPAVHIEQQVLRYKAALTITKLQLASIKEQIPNDAPDEIKLFIDTHLLMLSDDAFVEGPINIIYQENCNAEWALLTHKNKLVEIFQEMDDEYLQTREDDIAHLVNRVLSILIHGVTEEQNIAHNQHEHSHILITHDISPTDLIVFKTHGGVAIVTERGGPTSHAAILARSLNIPTIFAANNICQYLKQHESIIIDATLGFIIAQTDGQFYNYYCEKNKQQQKHQQQLLKIKNTTAKTINDVSIRLEANIELPGDLDHAVTVGAQGIGLYRTEYLFLNTPSFPDETEQLHIYLSAVTTMAPNPVTIRTIDLGNDKIPPQWQRMKKNTPNPALGMRAIRLCLQHIKIFRTQIKAILRASALGKVKLLLPLLSSIDELDRALIVINDVKQELTAQGFAFDPNIPIGGMMEVPSAAITADLFAEKLDFFSIGTNDLIQYTLAVDRNNEEVNYLYDPLNPAVLRLISMISTAGYKKNIPVCLCGEMANDKQLIPILLGLGITYFSVTPANLLAIKQEIGTVEINQDLKTQVKKLINSQNLTTREQVLTQIRNSARARSHR